MKVIAISILQLEMKVIKSIGVIARLNFIHIEKQDQLLGIIIWVGFMCSNISKEISMLCYCGKTSNHTT